MEDDSSSYKSSHQYADHLKEKSEAVSQFAKSKSVREQRQYLPIFAAKQEVSRTLNNIFLPLVCVVTQIL